MHLLNLFNLTKHFQEHTMQSKKKKKKKQFNLGRKWRLEGELCILWAYSKVKPQTETKTKQMQLGCISRCKVKQEMKQWKVVIGTWNYHSCPSWQVQSHWPAGRCTLNQRCWGYCCSCQLTAQWEVMSWRHSSPRPWKRWCSCCYKPPAGQTAALRSVLTDWTGCSTENSQRGVKTGLTDFIY